MNDFLTFRKFVTPVFIQIIFWILAAVLVVGLLISGAQAGGTGILIALVMIPVGVLMLRIYCEILIIIFKIYDALVDLRGGAPTHGFPVQPTYQQPYAQQPNPQYPPQG